MGDLLYNVVIIVIHFKKCFVMKKFIILTVIGLFAASAAFADTPTGVHSGYPNAGAIEKTVNKQKREKAKAEQDKAKGDSNSNSGGGNTAGGNGGNSSGGSGGSGGNGNGGNGGTTSGES